MSKVVTDKEAVIEALAAMDPVYQNMLRKQSEMEQRFDKMVKQLPDEHRELAWDFVMICEDMSQRMLYLSCAYMDFPGQPGNITLPDDDEQRKAAARSLAHKVMDAAR